MNPANGTSSDQTAPKRMTVHGQPAPPSARWDTRSVSEPEPDHVAATRTVYDHSADLYAELVGTSMSPNIETDQDRATLDAFADEVLAGTVGQVLDIGCGPGRVTRYLDDLGLEIAGVDISSQMIATAKGAHPDLRFEVGALTALPVTDASLVGAVLWYSIIHTPPTDLREVWNELRRVLANDAPVLIAFQAGENDRIDRPDAYGSSMTLTLYRHSIEDVQQTLSEAGFQVIATTRRSAELAHESTPQAFVRANRNR